MWTSKLLRLKPFRFAHPPSILKARALTNAAPNFDNYQESFQSKSTFDLIRACSILSLCSIDTLVDKALPLMRAGESILGNALFSKIMHKTFYGQFVAGEAGPAVPNAAERLRNQGLTLMVAPALESDIGEGSNTSLLEANRDEYLRLAELAGQVKSGITGRKACLQLKMTALVPVGILTQLTLILNKCNDEKKITIVEIFSRLISGNAAPDIGNSILSAELLYELQKACSRLQSIGAKAKEMEIKLLVDMEWTYVNPACSALASAMMVSFNKEFPLVGSTVQCYLKAALETFKWENEVARHFGVCYGAKLVRGAYLEKERQVAPSMVCSDYAETSANYERVASHAIKNAVNSKNDKYFIVVATHNEAAINNATSLLDQLKSGRHPNVAFAQIYGMAEHISLPLAQHDYLVYKSVAFGTLHQVVPYLARRAAENRAIMKGARRERQLMMSEVKRRAIASLKM